MTSPTLQIVQQAIGLQLEPAVFSYDERDVALYALGIGAPADWLDQNELSFVYELSGRGLKVFPTFAVIFSKELNESLMTGDFAGIRFQPMMLVHGEQYLEILSLLPSRATVTTSMKVSDIFDKGSGLLIVINAKSVDQSGTVLARARSSVFIRGIGAFGGERGPSAASNLPQRSPDIIHEEGTLETQALLYRLSSDANPLHVDPQMAALGNYEKPILHGLCSYGFAARAIVKHCCENDALRLQSIGVRFAKHVFPGETLRTEIWLLEDGHILFQTKAKERDVVVLSHGKARTRG